MSVPEEVIDQLTEAVDEVAGNSSRWSQEDSVEIYEAVAAHCRDWAQTIRQEMNQ